MDYLPKMTQTILRGLVLQKIKKSDFAYHFGPEKEKTEYEKDSSQKSDV